MKITITLQDVEGHVKMDCNPHQKKLVQAYREGDMTPALVWAVLAIGRLQQESEKVQTEIDKEKRESEIMNNGIIKPWSPRKEQGPQEENFIN